MTDPLECFDYIAPGFGGCSLCDWVAYIADDTALVETFITHYQNRHQG